jgi:hypothetical protein
VQIDTNLPVSDSLINQADVGMSTGEGQDYYSNYEEDYGSVEMSPFAMDPLIDLF